MHEEDGTVALPVKTLLEDLPRKDPFSCISARSCEILQDIVRSCGVLQESCRNLQDSCKILHAYRNARIKDLSFEDLARAFYWADFAQNALD